MDCFSFTDYIINEKNLLGNIAVIKSKISSGVKLCAVLKANAYGVGSRVVAKLINGQVDCFAVATLGEGIELRSAGFNKAILVLGAVNLNQISMYEKYFLTPTVSTVYEMSKLSSDVKNPLRVEFGLNTGMCRIGFCEKSKIKQALGLKNQNKKISLWGVFSHLATKECDVNFMYEQKHKFDELLTIFKDEKVVRHVSNTNAALNHKDFNYDMVRTGFGLYGMGENDCGLNPVVSIYSRVVKINKISKGDSVGYDRTFIAGKDMRVAVVPIGYYDGISRMLSNVGCVVINGRRAKILGRICMDMFMVDITDIDCVNLGTKVEILGDNIMLSDYAKWSGTSEYEALTRFNNSRMNIVIK